MLFLLAALYLWFVVDPHLIYQGFGTLLPDAPAFVTGWSLLKNALGLPGGFAMYLTGFFSQGYYHAWLGAGIIVLCALVLCELSRRHLLAFAGGRAAAVLTSVPAIAIVLICGRYKHALPACVVVSLGLLSSLVFERLPLRRPAARALACCGMAAVVFWWAGGGGLLVFALMTVVHELLVRRHWRLPALAVPVSLVIVWGLARYVFLLPTQQALLTLTPTAPTVAGGMKAFSRSLVFVLYGFVPLSALLLFVGKAVVSKRTPRRSRRSRTSKAGKSQGPAASRKLPLPRIEKVAAMALPIVLVGVGLYVSHNPMTRAFILAHDYAVGRQWGKILELSRRLPPGTTNPYFNHDVIRALYHTGRLPHDMFHFPMLQDALFLTHEKRFSYLTQSRLCDTLLELGQVNAAEKMASEILAGQSHSAGAMETLAWINIIKGQTRTARVYLNALKKDLVHRSAAKALLGALDGGFPPDQAAYISRIRSRIFPQEYPGTIADPIEQTLTALLDRNPRNRMAFEYLMAAYLLTGQVGKIAGNVERLDELGYQGIPTLYEEAILIHVYSRGSNRAVNEFPIRQTTLQRYARFVQLRQSLQSHNRRAALRQLIVEFGTSYFFYFSFGYVGVA
jgi:hypothetical protein